MLNRPGMVLLAVAAAALSALVVGAESSPQSKRDSDAMKRKVAAILAAGERPARQIRQTTVTENEVNAYLANEVRQDLPTGVVEPAITILGSGRLSGRAVVDLDGVRKGRTSTSLLDPRAYLVGHLPVTATGILRTANGTGRFELESATVAGVPIPKFFLQEILSYYSKTPDKPSGINMDDSFMLPARIREVRVDRGQAVIVQ